MVRKRDRSTSDTRMPLNSVTNITDYVVNDEKVFKQFEEALVAANSEKTINGWILDNNQVLNGRFGKKLETPLHR